MYKDSQWMHGLKLVQYGHKAVAEAHDQLAHTDYIGAPPKYLEEMVEEGMRLVILGRCIQETAEKK